MAKGVVAHYAPETLALAERLYNCWSLSFKRMQSKPRGWNEISTALRIAWCEVALEVSRLGP